MKMPQLTGNGETGYIVEGAVGSIESGGNFRASISYHRVESDAVLAAYDTDDWWLPTRGQGFRILTSSRVARPLILTFSYLDQKLIGTDLHFKRYQASAEIVWPK